MPTNVFTDSSIPHNGPKYQITNAQKAVRVRLSNKYVECAGFGDQHIVKMTKIDGLADALHTAYAEHNSFTWSPDSLWLRIAQGLATHIRLHSDELRQQIVGFEGQKELKYRNDSFTKNENNPWELFFNSMSHQIGENTNDDLRTLFTTPFSTSLPIHAAVANGLLMDSCSDYFSYRMQTMCGIPEFRFTGSPEDWESVKIRAQYLTRYGAKMIAWYEALSPILDEFILASQGTFNINFWRDMYKVHNQSGGPYVSGWVNKLYPYTNNDAWNKYAVEDVNFKSWECGICTSNFPSGLSSIPFKWEYYDQLFDMELVVGAFGVQQDPETGSLSPAYGWAVIDTKMISENIEEKPVWMKTVR